ncbi:sigma-70 family RNA polymerase sigma factor [Fulvivirgaceae bacterium BMA12]|uniref:Sigma-70 family RNA polymerase sigma factor n=1 Tax=Agaribacillus aureus TaxID=3051825 RepID=A0ABT8L753_9BACT|nr:sigma-70 family RNA polymerase sigma factor [Fulvivirgaceae bacterium BMA12]
MKANPDKSNIDSLVDRHFRREHGTLMAVLVGLFGTENLELAEDIVQDTLLKALQHWKAKGIPDNPSGWLYKVAKNQAYNTLKREKYKKRYQASQPPQTSGEINLEEIFDTASIKDEQLKMMFACCDSVLSQESQVALILKTLCGFSVDEITRAFLTKKETITKRLTRARTTMRHAGVSFALPPDNALEERLDSILQTIYLIYNEGYNASGGDRLIRKELCEEGIRLANFLASCPVGNKPKTHALLGLMYFNFSRFETRLNKNKEIILLADQDRSRWNHEHIALGFYHLSKIVEEEEVSTYHLQAAISACHASADTSEKTDWHKIVTLYNYLQKIDPSPVVLLNKAVALGNINKISEAIQLLDQEEVKTSLSDYYLYFVVFSDLLMKQEQYKKAKKLLIKALNLTNIKAEKHLITSRLTFCTSKIS